MSSIFPNKNKFIIDDLEIHKLQASNKFDELLTFVDRSKEENKSNIRLASNGNNNQIIELFSKMMDYLKINHDGVDLNSLYDKMATKDNGELQKSAALNKSSDRKDEIKIVSKNQKDSHYQFDISKDTIVRSGKKMVMVSCYVRDAYLGRYLIKRNFFYTADRENIANESYDEIKTKVGQIKDRYYNDLIDVSEIFAQTKRTLDGVISEIKMEEDSVGNVTR